jgi:hypothetical protein
MTVLPFRRPLPATEPQRGSGAPLANPGMSFEEFVEINREHIWDLIVIGDRRDVTFNQVALECWGAL